MNIITRFVEGSMVLLPLLFVSICGSAQQTGIPIIRLRADTAIHGAQEKLASEVLMALDPDIRFSVHSDRTLLKIGLKPSLDVGTVREVLMEVGIHTSVINAPPYADGLIKRADDLPEGFPVFIHTGNIEQDNQNYQAAKAAWIEAHPDAYEQLILAAPAE